MTVVASVERDRGSRAVTEQAPVISAASSPEALWRAEDARARKRWTTALVVVVAIHAAPMLLLVRRETSIPPLPAPPPAAIMIDMAPAPAKPAPPPPPPPDPAPAKPRPVVRTFAPLAPLPRIADAAATLATEPQSEQRPPQRTQETQTAAPPASPAAAMPPAQLPEGAAEPNITAPNWQSLVLGRLQHFMRYPAEAQSRREQGTAYLHFAMDRDGHVLSFSLEHSSGHVLLDQEALALIQRAQPLPKPPASVPGNPVELVVPIEFSLRKRW